MGQGNKLADPSAHRKELIGTVYDFLAKGLPVDEMPKAEVIFVLGHNGPEPANHAAKLFHNKRAPRILVSGCPNDNRNILNQAGVPGINITLEDLAKNTEESLAYGIADYKRKFSRFPDRVILVCMPPLLCRAHATMSKQWPMITVYPATFTLDPLVWPPERWHDSVLLEIERLIEYASKDKIAQVEIPAEVTAAAGLLKLMAV